MKHKLHLLILPLVALAIISSASAQVLLKYEMALPVRSAPGFVAEGFSATNLTVNNTTLAYASTHGVDSQGIRPAEGYTQATVNLATTLTNATYVYFTLTPDSATPYSLASLDFGAYAAGSSLRSFYIFSSATGYTADKVLLSETYNATSADVINYSIDLSNIAAFQDITGSVTFRIYVQTNSTTASINFSNITLTAVPEPASATLLAGCGVFLLMRRFRKSVRTPVVQQ